MNILSYISSTSSGTSNACKIHLD